MQRLIESFKGDLAKIRTGRAHTGLLDHVMVDYYGARTPISQVARVTLLDAHTLCVQPWEKMLLSSVEKAIRDAGLGLNPAASGESVRVPMPPLTEARRLELVKIVKGEGETARIAIRNLRREANDQLKKSFKDKEISEDDERRTQDEVQRLTDNFIDEIEQLVQTKANEIVTV